MIRLLINCASFALEVGGAPEYPATFTQVEFIDEARGAVTIIVLC